jgi:hypothetical protein
LQYFHEETHDPYRSDICRTAALYLKGGYYFDSELVTMQPVDLDKRECDFSSVLSDRRLGFMATSLKNPLFLESMEVMTTTFEERE